MSDMTLQGMLMGMCSMQAEFHSSSHLLPKSGADCGMGNQPWHSHFLWGWCETGDTLGVLFHPQPHARCTVPLVLESRGKATSIACAMELGHFTDEWENIV